MLAEWSGFWDLSTLRLQVVPPKRLTNSAVVTARAQAGLELGLLEPSRLVSDGHGEGLCKSCLIHVVAMVKEKIVMLWMKMICKIGFILPILK